MEPNLETPEHLRDALAKLVALEPRYHAAAPDATPQWFDRLVAPDFWEIGASGRRYSRAFSRKVLIERERMPKPEDWDACNYHLDEPAPGFYLLTYTLQQPGRATLRSTLWRKDAEGFKALFHQGTPVQDIEIDYKNLSPTGRERV